MRQRMGFDVIDGHGDQVMKTDVLADQETQIFKPKLPKGNTEDRRLKTEDGERVFGYSENSFARCTHSPSGASC